MTVVLGYLRKIIDKTDTLFAGKSDKSSKHKKSKKSKEAKQAAKLDSSEESDVQPDRPTHDAYISCDGTFKFLKLEKLLHPWSLQQL